MNCFDKFSVILNLLKLLIKQWILLESKTGISLKVTDLESKLHKTSQVYDDLFCYISYSGVVKEQSYCLTFPCQEKVVFSIPKHTSNESITQCSSGHQWFFLVPEICNKNFQPYRRTFFSRRFHLAWYIEGYPRSSHFFFFLDPYNKSSDYLGQKWTFSVSNKKINTRF